MQTDLIEKARAGRMNALMALPNGKDGQIKLAVSNLFRELDPNVVRTVFDTTQSHFVRHKIAV